MSKENLKKFTDLPKVKEKIKRICESISIQQLEYSEKLQTEPFNYIGLKNIDTGIWMTKIDIHGSFRYCLENLSILNDMQFEIVLASVINYLDNTDIRFINFESLNNIIYKEMEVLKVRYEIDKETNELFKPQILDPGLVHKRI